ncbi:MAG: hypothetical protein DRO00_09750 [Thermoproteota archaeon]|nr:MAG: hypothetical protein DRO00_09750 [Candidatus Korarchaeota archaeon]
MQDLGMSKHKEVRIQTKHKLALLIVAVVVSSTSSILTRLSSAPSLIIAFYRLGIASIIMGFLAIPSANQLLELNKSQIAALIVSGLSLALHFWSWIGSLKLIPVATSIVLVDSAPISAGIMSKLILREPPSKREWLGIFLGVVGALIVVGKPQRGGSLFGAVLALIGSIAFSIYLISGRYLRKVLDTIPYAASVYGVAFLILLVITVGSNIQIFGYNTREVLIFFALAIGPSCLAHTSYNYALKHLKAHGVSIAILGEPIGATLLAWILLDEPPGIGVVLGGLLIIVGSILTLKEE